MNQTDTKRVSKRPTSALLGGLAVALSVAAASVYWYTRSANELAVNKPPGWSKDLLKMEESGVPDFSLQDLYGKPFKLSENLGQITIINFWASWCAPCVEEFPSMLKLVKEMQGRVKVVAVSADTDEADLRNFLKAFGLPKENFAVVWDRENAVRKMYGVEKVPESFIVNPELKLLKKVLGIDNWSTPGALEFFRSLLKPAA